MVILVQALLAFVLAFLVSGSELVTSKYPRTSFLLRKCRPLYVYAAIYGAIAFIVKLALNALIDAEAIKLEGVGLSNPWFQAIAVGIGIKAFLHIRLFSVSYGNAGSEPFPVGVESFIQIFEPWLLRTIELNHYNQLRNYIRPRASQYRDLGIAKQRMIREVPRSFAKDEVTAFKRDIDESKEVDEAMEFYLGLVGKEVFERVFPLPTSPKITIEGERNASNRPRIDT
jgi:hypothetical protein